MSEEKSASGSWDSIRVLLGACWNATAGDRVRVTAFVILYLLAYSFELAVTFATGYVLSLLARGDFTQETFHQVCLGIVGLISIKIVCALLHHTARYLNEVCAFEARFKKIAEIFGALLSFPLKWHVHHHSGESLSRMHRSVSAVDSVIANYFWQTLDGVVKFLLATAAICSIDPGVAACILGMGGISLVFMIGFNARLARNIRKNNRYHDRLQRTLVDYVSNIITVKTLRLEEPAREYFAAHRAEGRRLKSKISRYQELKWGSIAVGHSLVLGGSLFLYSYNHVGSGEPPDIAAIYVLLDRLGAIFAVITSFTGYYSGYIEAGINYDDATSVINEAAANHVTVRPTRLPADWKEVSLRGLDFSYSGDALNLKGLNLTFQRGQKIALVGPSGGGKSTLLKVLAGMLQVARAEVTSPGAPALDIDDISSVSLLVPQEPEIFSETLRHNLTLGEPYEQWQLQRALEICCVEHLLEKLPNGWESHLKERGMNVSVGERQRIALARGVLRTGGKDIVLLDEPTSSLDPNTETKIFQRFLAEYADRTMMMACHRLALAPLFDRIIFVRDGRIEEDGTLAELKARGGGFAQAWSEFERNLGSGEAAAA
jgi:ABC-type multidrug transport system fused ATPase/permease subunit